jgi:two-component system LytT family sensor kinase
MLDRRMKRALAIAAAWLPFLALWQMFAMQAGATFLRALPFSVYAIGSASLLGLAVSRLCASMPWQLRVRFYLVHVAAAIVYSSIWTSGMVTFARIVDGAQSQRMAVAGWFLEGIWLYAILTAFSYTILTQRRALAAEKNLAVARLDALRSRLHPHFLFNALHTVGALVRHDPAEAEGAVEKLGDMLRYTLRDGESDAVPFAEEWEFTRRYLEFEQLRYGDRLRVTSDIDPRALACTAPSFALQTLVENSVRHSISTRAQGGMVEISARVGEERLHIKVRDDGGNGVTSEPGARYGLSALRERLETVYGSRLNVSRNDTGFEVEFSVPCSPSGGDDDE